MKKFFAILLSAMLMLSLAVPAMAAGESGYTITINGTAGHTYEVYQIFTGDLSGNVLSNIVWGDGVSEAGQTALGNAAEKAATLTDDNIKEFAAAVKQYLANPSTMTESNGTYTLSGLEAGYYLIKDKDDSQEGEYGTYTAYMLKVVTDVTATPKGTVPTVEKTLPDHNDATGSIDNWDQPGGVDHYGSAASYNVGDLVPFYLIGTLPDNYAEYSTYKYVFHDTLSDGLMYDATLTNFGDGGGNDAYISKNEGDAALKVTAYLDGNVDNNSSNNVAVITGHFNVSYDEVTNKLTIACNNLKDISELNASSKIVVSYTAKLTEAAVIGGSGNTNKVKLEFSNNPNVGGEGSTGSTPEDEVVVYTYQLEIKKTDGEKNLAGADFKLEKFCLDDKGSVKYKPAPLEGYWTTLTPAASENAYTFNWKHLEPGWYCLTETETPDGYNSIEPVYFLIEATYDAAGKIASLTAYETDEDGYKKDNTADYIGDINSGVISTNIVNNAGATLPETGGMGTTIFYIVGGLMVVGAVVLLVTKKRMSAEG